MATEEVEEQWYVALYEEDCLQVMKLLKEYPGLLKVGWQSEPARQVEGRWPNHFSPPLTSTWKGRTALHVGARRGCVQLVKQVLMLCNLKKVISVYERREEESIDVFRKLKHAKVLQAPNIIYQGNKQLRHIRTEQHGNAKLVKRKPRPSWPPPTFQAHPPLQSDLQAADSPAQSNVLDAQSNVVDAQSNVVDAQSNLFEPPPNLVEPPPNLVEPPPNLLEGEPILREAPSNQVEYKSNLVEAQSNLNEINLAERGSAESEGRSISLAESTVAEWHRRVNESKSAARRAFNRWGQGRTNGAPSSLKEINEDSDGAPQTPSQR